MTKSQESTQTQLACMLCDGGVLIVPLRRKIYAAVKPIDFNEWRCDMYNDNVVMFSRILNTEELMETLLNESKDSDLLLPS